MWDRLGKHQVLSKNKSEGKAWTKAFTVVSRAGMGKEVNQANQV